MAAARQASGDWAQRDGRSASGLRLSVLADALLASNATGQQSQALNLLAPSHLGRPPKGPVASNARASSASARSRRQARMRAQVRPVCLPHPRALHAQRPRLAQQRAARECRPPHLQLCVCWWHRGRRVRRPQEALGGADGDGDVWGRENALSVISTQAMFSQQVDFVPDSLQADAPDDPKKTSLRLLLKSTGTR